MHMSKLFLTLAALTALALAACSKSESRWEEAVKVNTAAAFEKYVADFPESTHAPDARNRIDDLSWATASQENSVTALQRYMTAFPKGKSAADARSRIEDLEWSAALAAPQKEGLLALIAKYPDSKHAAQGRDQLWALDWPPVPVTKANSVTVWTKGQGLMMGEIQFSIGAFGALGGDSTSTRPAGPNRIQIWRDFSPEEEPGAAKIGLRTGMAFLKSDKGEYKLVRKVDLSKSDEELAAEFGIKVQK